MDCRGIREAAPFQLEAADFLYQRNHSMVFARPGAGKTLPTLLTLADWRDAGESRRALIAAPLKVAHNVWRQECAKWEVPLTMSLCTGETEDKRAAIEAKTDVLITNHNMLGKILESDHGCDTLIIDELSRFRAHNGSWQKQARNSGMKITVGLTGSPTPNNYLSLYGMSRAIGLELFGRNFDKWKRAHFYPTDYEGHKWAPFPGDETVFEAIRPYTYVLDDKSAQLPPVVRPPMQLQLPDDVRTRYRELRKTSELTDLQIVASNAGVLTGKLRQIAAGFIYDNSGKPVGLSPFRIQALAALVEEMQGEPLLVAYEWVEQLAMLQSYFPHVPYLGGNSKNDDDTLAQWNQRKLPVLFIHPASAGHGLNMAQGGNSVAWLQPPHDNELYEQLIGRVRRRDQASAQVFSYEFVAENTLDEAVQQTCHQRGRDQDALWAKFT